VMSQFQDGGHDVISRRKVLCCHLMSDNEASACLSVCLSHIGDQQMDGFEQWAFMTTHSWDEPSAGIWRLEVRNGQSACEYQSQYQL